MRKERNYLWHVKPVWGRNSVAVWQGVISLGRQRLEPGAAGGEEGRERGRGLHGEGLWWAALPGLPAARAPLWNADLLRAHVAQLLSGPQRIQKGLVGWMGGGERASLTHGCAQPTCFFWHWAWRFSNYDVLSSGRRGGGSGAGQKALLFKLSSHPVLSGNCTKEDTAHPTPWDPSLPPIPCPGLSAAPETSLPVSPWAL